uniref:Chemokine interleukin-8-like domain-containing protein n=1 Tax=Prolemur simus TaxID=1328070 RepID=A0A8C8ZQ41_PROSS
MSLKPNAITSCTSDRPLRVLQVLLLLSLFLTTVVPTYVKEGKRNLGKLKEEHAENLLCVELQCRCGRTLSRIHPSLIHHVEVFNPGTHCSNVEVIATLRSGNKICLNPDSPVIRKIIFEMVDD